MCFDVSIPIRLIWSTDGLPCLRSFTRPHSGTLMPSGAVHTNKSIKVSAWFYSAIALVVIAAGMLAGGYYWGHRAGVAEAVAEVHETEAGLREAFAGGSASARIWLSWIHMWTAPSSQGVLQCFDQIACVHMSGLWCART